MLEHSVTEDGNENKKERKEAELQILVQ